MANKNTYKFQSISIDAVQLDPENYRTGVQESQRDAILAVIEDQGKKLVTLAKDILDIGLSPLEAFAVMPVQAGARRYIVLEGNRRLTALKLVREPDLAEGTPIHAAFKRLRNKSADDLPSTLPCVVMSRAEARPWIQRKHDKGLEGAGVESWGAEAKHRFQADGGDKDPMLVIVDSVRAQGDLDDEQRELLENLPMSTLERIIGDAYVKEKLGLQIQGGVVQSTLDQKLVLKALTKILLDLASKRVDVNAVRTKPQRQKYIDSFGKGEIPNAGNPRKPWNFEEPATRPGKTAANKERSSIKTAVPLNKQPSKLIPSSGVTLNITDAKASQVLNELRRLKINEFKFAAAVTLRSFLELSCYWYQKQNGLSVGKQMELHLRITTVADHLESAGLATRNELKGVRKAASTKNDVTSTDTLNAYVHNPYFVPTASDLVTTWGQLQPFLEKIWR